MVIRNQMTSSASESNDDGAARPGVKTPPLWAPTTSSSVIAVRQSADGKTVDARNFIIIIIFFHPLLPPLLPTHPSDETPTAVAVYYTKMATANCEPDYDSRSSVAAADENSIILLMNRNPFAVGRFAFRVIKN